jgi:glycosyltransferase A (GT-A) superfamily protein (DUF2064 family)
MVTLVFVRAPEAGRVKTRLAATLGNEGALRVYRRLAEHTVREARSVDAELRIHFTPAGKEHEVRAWLGDGARYLAQAGGGLGERMEEAFRAAFADGAGRVVIVGSDLPACPRRCCGGRSMRWTSTPPCWARRATAATTSWGCG